jgi:hypothetical protein
VVTASDIEVRAGGGTAYERTVTPGSVAAVAAEAGDADAVENEDIAASTPRQEAIRRRRVRAKRSMRWVTLA